MFAYSKTHSFSRTQNLVMQVKEKCWSQYIPRPLNEVWSFFSRPENLNNMTPGTVSFEILSDVAGVEMFPGMIVRYRISPFGGIKMRWVTEITHVAEGRYFIDEQRFGPYAFWHHLHRFEPQGDGVLMTDVLHYKVPYGILGDVVNMLLVEPKINEIFSYRKKAVEEMFGKG